MVAESTEMVCFGELLFGLQLQPGENLQGARFPVQSSNSRGRQVGLTVSSDALTPCSAAAASMQTAYQPEHHPALQPERLGMATHEKKLTACKRRLRSRQ